MRALDRVLSLVGAEREGVAHYVDSSPSDVRGLLADHAELGLACLDAWMETGERRYLESAQGLAAFALERLGPEGGAFLDRPEGSADGALAIPARPLEENSAMASVLIRLGRLLREDELVERAGEALSSFASGYEPYDMMGAPFALAVDEFLTDPLHVTVVGEGADAALLRDAAFIGYRPYRLVDTLTPSRDQDLLERARYPATGQSRAYVCIGALCHAPTADPAEITRLSGRASPDPSA